MRYRRGHSTVLATAAALCVLPLGQGGAAFAVEADGLSAYRTAARAKEVTGSASDTGGPLLRPGTYTDTIGPGEKKFYAVDLDAKSDVYVSVVAAPAPGAAVRPDDGIRVLLQQEDGHECGSGEARFREADSGHPLADYAVRRLQPDPGPGPAASTCRYAGRYRVVVERTKAAGDSAAVYPTELKYMTEPGLKRGGMEAAPGPGTWRPVAASSSDKAVKRVAGGTGFNDAPPVTTGVWRDDALPGQTRFYRIPVSWGQRLSVVADVPKAFAPPGFHAPGGVRIGLNNPARGFAGEVFEDYRGAPRTISLGTAPVAYDNRLRGRTDPANAMRVAGWYYLQVGLHPKVGEVVSHPVPVTLRVSVEGTPKAAPAYDGDAEAAGFGVTADPQAVADDGDARRQALRIGGYVGVSTGSALLCWLGGWWLLARRSGRWTAARPGSRARHHGGRRTWPGEVSSPR
ncbi:hypothetical protein IPZ58_29255 [Streptomyces roseoverticillatus]|uniref:hypothetical protein n=1 Tax=Streptomyces roseoverticillatus TaxID=66429 RepID=UPI001F37B63A|nr:hypothetical protein [Streptomyces roseoverticillatus]MCF3105652.1 hypothetical protein [Streptomyces roseoverticillatus]